MGNLHVAVDTWSLRPWTPLDYVLAEALPPKLSRSAGVRKAHEFVLAMYAFTPAVPKAGDRRSVAAVASRGSSSIPANIAEGFRRRGKTDKALFMNLAEGSLEECRYYFDPATRSSDTAIPAAHGASRGGE